MGLSRSGGTVRFADGRKIELPCCRPPATKGAAGLRLKRNDGCLASKPSGTRRGGHARCQRQFCTGRQQAAPHRAGRRKPGSSQLRSEKRFHPGIPWYFLSSLILIIAIIAAGCSGERPDKGGNFDGESAMRYVQAQMQFGARIPGSLGAQRAGDWIIAEMNSRADTVIVQSWTHTTADGKQLPMRNILARFRPADASRILYVTHWDTRPVSDNSSNLGERQMPVPGANDGGSGVALFMALADALKKAPPPSGVDLLFVDGEDYGSFGPPMVDVLIGSTWFASHLPEPGYKPIFGVLWDMIGDRDLKIKKELYSIQGAPEVVDRVWRVAAELGHDDVFVDEQYGYGITDDHVPLLQAGLRVIDVIDIDYPNHHRPTDTIDKISARSLSIVGEVAEALLR